MQTDGLCDLYPFGACPQLTLTEVNISLYVVFNSKRALYSMTAWDSGSDGDGYKVPVYYSADGSDGPFYTLP